MSSSDSWYGAGRGRGGGPTDIIDLDKFMRSGVRSSRQMPSVEHLCDRLVVDTGGPSRKVNVSSSRESTSVGRPTELPVRGVYQKRYSHDSGLSDGSYTRRRHRPHRCRRVSGQEGAFQHRDARARHSTDSLRAFRAVCERALLDQQKQIARVARLCEWLTVKQTEKEKTGEPSASGSPDTSDLSSSSMSTGYQRRKNKHRTPECKTYKIIMNKLDKLNRLFTARGRSPLERTPAPAPRLRCTPSSGSVTVTDKVVATEPEIKPCRVIEKQSPQLVERAVGAGSGSGSVRNSAVGSQERSPRSATLHAAAVRAVTKAYAFDISPNAHQRRERPNVTTQSIYKHEFSTDVSNSSKCDPRCGFDLNDPLHLYSQAKRLQTLHASTRRRAFSTDDVPFLIKYDEREHERERSESKMRKTSLCSLCRYYWRSFSNFLAGQLFCCPDNYKYS